MNISSYYQALTSFNSQELVEISKRAVIDSIPGIPLLGFLADLIHEIYPNTCLDGNPSNSKSTTFILDGSIECTEKIMDLYLQRRVTMASTPLIETALKTKLKAEMVQFCQNLIAKTAQIGADFGIAKIRIAVEIPTYGQDFESAFGEIGGTCGCSDPVILFTPRRFDFGVVKATRLPIRPLLAEQRFLGLEEKNIREFAIAHEVVHISKNHALIHTINRLALAILTTCLWMTAGFSLAGILGTFTVVTGVSFLFNLLYAAQKRCQEKEADLEAINYLQTSVGAVDLFEAWQGMVMPPDPDHPSMADRFEYCANWRMQPIPVH